VGIVLNPATPVEVLRPYAHLIEKVTVMTVDPGYAGQPFIPEMVAKIKQLSQFRTNGGHNFLIEADGSCNRNTYSLLLNAGAQVLIMESSGLFKKDIPIAQTWQVMVNDIAETVVAENG